LTVVLYFLALGLINWFSTLLLVESEFFRPMRDWVVNYAANWEAFMRAPPTARRFVVWYWRAARLIWTKLAYVSDCHVCIGTWVGLALVPWAPVVFGAGVVPFILTGLLIKAIGHLILVAHKVGEHTANLLKVRANSDNETSPIGRRRRERG
jgi:hypothetical protein